MTTTPTPVCTITTIIDGTSYGTCDDGSQFAESACAPGTLTPCTSMPPTGTQPVIFGGATVLLAVGLVLAVIGRRRSMS